ncbi:MAG: hypothetical protein AAFR17_02455 [Pseudomonadota bacterium]
MTAPVQLTFDLPQRTARSRAAFLVAPSNRDAVALIDRWREWPEGRAALIGPPRAGKSHLVEVWRHETGAQALPATELGALAAPVEGALALEDVDQLPTLGLERQKAAEIALFHLYNRQNAARWPLLMTGRREPSLWKLELADLRSRVATLPLARIDLPDDALLSSVLGKLFTDRQLTVGTDVIAFLLKRMERSCEAAEALVETLDRAALRLKRPVTVPFVREIMGWT